MDKTLLNLVSIGRESDPARIEKLESMKKEMLDYAARRVNENFVEDDFVHLFADSLDYYNEEYRNRMGQLWNDGENWKDEFKGCLFVRE